MKLDRLDFIKALEAKQVEYTMAKEITDASDAEKQEKYLQAVQEYRKKIQDIITSGIEYKVERGRWNSDLVVSLPEGTSIPEAPTPPKTEHAFYGSYGGHSTIDFKNRAKLLDTLRISKETEINLTKQILDLV
jgi:hypothetical protein